MVDKSELLRQMRKHAKTFSSAIEPPKKVDQKSINHALALIDLFAKETNFGSLRKFTFNIPDFLKVIGVEGNLDFLKNKHEKKTSYFSGDIHLKNKKKKEKKKFNQAEKKLLKLLSTKYC